MFLIAIGAEVSLFAALTTLPVSSPKKQRNTANHASSNWKKARRLNLQIQKDKLEHGIILEYLVLVVCTFEFNRACFTITAGPVFLCLRYSIIACDICLISFRC